MVSYVMSMPLHKRDVLGYIVSYIRRIVEMRPANQKDAADITKVFGALRVFLPCQLPLRLRDVLISAAGVSFVVQLQLARQ